MSTTALETATTTLETTAAANNKSLPSEELLAAQPSLITYGAQANAALQRAPIGERSCGSKLTVVVTQRLRRVYPQLRKERVTASPYAKCR